MKLLDAIGNTILSGNTLYWKDKDLYVKVAEVMQPDDKGAPGGLMVMMALPLKDTPGKAIQLPDFIRTVDPQSEAIAEAMAEKARMADEIAHEPYSAAHGGH